MSSCCLVYKQSESHTILGTKGTSGVLKSSSDACTWHTIVLMYSVFTQFFLYRFFSFLSIAMQNRLDFWCSCNRKSNKKVQMSRVNIRIYLYNIPKYLRAGLLSSLTILQPCLAITLKEVIFHRTSAIIIFCANSSLGTGRCSSATGHVLLWVLALFLFFPWVEKITLLLLLLNFCHSFNVAVSYTTTHSWAEQVQACSLVAVKMHFTQCRKTLTEAAAAGEDNKTHVALYATVL